MKGVLVPIRWKTVLLTSTISQYPSVNLIALAIDLYTRHKEAPPFAVLRPGLSVLTLAAANNLPFRVLLYLMRKITVVASLLTMMDTPYILTNLDCYLMSDV